MALAVTDISEYYQEDGRKVIYATIDDTSYAAGGTVYTAGDFKMAQVDEIEFLDNMSDTGMIRRHDKANKKLVAHKFDYDAVADGGSIEASATNDTGAQRVRVIGF